MKDQFCTRANNLATSCDAQYIGCHKLIGRLILQFCPFLSDDNPTGRIPKAAIDSFQRLQDMKDLDDNVLFPELSNIDYFEFIHEPTAKYAKLLNERIQENSINKMIEHAHSNALPESITRIVSSTSNYHWFFASPEDPATQLNNTQWENSVCLWLGLPFANNSILDNNCKLCGQNMDIHGKHAFTCTGLVGSCRRQTHDNITLSLKNGAIRAMGNKSHPNHGKLRVIIEPNLSTFYGHENITIDEDADLIHSQRGSTTNNRDRGDIAFIDTTNNQNSRIIDVTTVFPTPTNAQRNDPRKIKLTSSYSFANEAEKRKATKYGKRFSINENADGPQHPAMPAAIDIYGAFGEGFNEVIKYIVKTLTPRNNDHSREPPGHSSAITRKLREYVQVALMRGNSANIQTWLRKCCTF
jgi:hypothetical protein